MKLNNEGEYVHEIGVVTKADFLNDYSKEFVDEHFEELANLWFKGMSAQVDFSMILESVKEEMGEKAND